MNRGSAALRWFSRADSGRASMRPRFMNRGSPREATSAAQRPESFNEAPIHESGKS